MRVIVFRFGDSRLRKHGSGKAAISGNCRVWKFEEEQMSKAVTIEAANFSNYRCYNRTNFKIMERNEIKISIKFSHGLQEQRMV